MKSSWRHIFITPAEIAHLSLEERVSLQDEALERYRKSEGRLRHQLYRLGLLFAGFLLFLLGIFASTFVEWWSGLDGRVLLASGMAPLALGALLGHLDSRRLHRALQSLLLERGIRPAVCFKCRYDLRESTGDACPECGEVIARSSAQA